MPKAGSPKPEVRKPEGWRGWDDYAQFYDWENAQTLDRRDVRFWQDLASRVGRNVLELGCGTGRVTLPMARTGARIVGVDRSAEMLSYARRRVARAKLQNLSLVRGDIRSLPFAGPAAPKPDGGGGPVSPKPDGKGGFDLVAAPYGILQSLVRESDLTATLGSVARVLVPQGVFGIDLVPDLPAWSEYRNQVRFRGRRHATRARITLVESVRQDRKRRLTIFDQHFTEERGGQRITRNFSLVFRTLTVPEMARRLEQAGFRVSAVLGDYGERPWDPRADVWLILAEKR